jgi:hypothetical protein
LRGGYDDFQHVANRLGQILRTTSYKFDQRPLRAASFSGEEAQTIRFMRFTTHASVKCIFQRTQSGNRNSLAEQALGKRLTANRRGATLRFTSAWVVAFPSTAVISLPIGQRTAFDLRLR